MKQIILLITLFSNGLCASSFDQSATILAPLGQVEESIKKVFIQANVNDGQERLNRFKKHIEVLKTDADCKPLMDQLKKSGFNQLFPGSPKDFLILNILGLKPTTLDMQDVQAKNLITQLINTKKITNILYQDNKIIAQPTIPFKVVFESYKNSSGNWKTPFCKGTDPASGLFETFKNVDTPQELFDDLKGFGDFPSSTDIDSESGAALFLGLQPIVTGISLQNDQVQEFLKFLHILLGVVSLEKLSDNKKNRLTKVLWDQEKIRSLNIWGGPPRQFFTEKSIDQLGIVTPQAHAHYSNERDIRGSLLPVLTFCNNLENYRFLLYTGFKAYNDHSHYIQLINLFMEYFFRKAFDDETYLQLLFQRIFDIVFELGTLLKTDYVKGQAGTQAWGVWDEFYQDITGPTKEHLSPEKEQSPPPLLATFKKFLDRIFGAAHWTWDDGLENFVIEESKQDAALKHFLITVDTTLEKNPLETKLVELKNHLGALQDKLGVLKKELHALQKKIKKS